MSYMQSNEGTKIPEAFKKKAKGRPPKTTGIMKGRMSYMKQIKKGEKK